MCYDDQGRPSAPLEFRPALLPWPTDSRALGFYLYRAVLLKCLHRQSVLRSRPPMMTQGSDRVVFRSVLSPKREATSRTVNAGARNSVEGWPYTRESNPAPSRQPRAPRVAIVASDGSIAANSPSRACRLARRTSICGRTRAVMGSSTAQSPPRALAMFIEAIRGNGKPRFAHAVNQCGRSRPTNV